MWSGTWGGTLADTTTTGTGGASRYSPVRQDNAWRAEWPLDDASYPEVVGFSFGSVINLYFAHSQTAGTPPILKGDRLVGTTVESVEKSVDPKSNVPTVVVSGRGGTLTTNLTIPG
jgi:hypothetical protein